MLTLQRYTFQVEYHKGSSLHIADTLSHAPLSGTSHKQVHDELVNHVEFENDNPELSGFLDATLQDISVASQVDPELIVLCSLIESGWPSEKAKVPYLVRPYWHVCHELTVNEGLLIKQDCVIIPTSLRQNILYKLHAAHCGSEFTLRHARNCLFWPGLNNQTTDMSRNCATCAQYAHQHPREPLHPTQCLLYLGNLFLKLYLNSMV